VCRRSSAFTLTEVLVVLGIIVLLLAMLLPALAGGQESARTSKTVSHLRGIAHMMQMYAGDNRGNVLPSQFNHHRDAFPGHPRCNPALGEWHARGTWADLLWTMYEMGAWPEAVPALSNDYQFDSPDGALYKLVGDIEHNPLRAAQPNTRDVFEGSGPTPYGSGAQERGLPGYLAANQFFNDDSLSPTYNGRFKFAQMQSPDRSMYLVDSYAGEVIEDEPAPFDTATDADDPSNITLEVDFRYADSCLILFLDGHSGLQGRWLDLDELEDDDDVRVRDLDRRTRGAAP
jgi:type II secretory pathway pseudopilin PulG